MHGQTGEQHMFLSKIPVRLLGMVFQVDRRCP